MGAQAQGVCFDLYKKDQIGIATVLGLMLFYPEREADCWAMVPASCGHALLIRLFCYCHNLSLEEEEEEKEEEEEEDELGSRHFFWELSLEFTRQR